MANTSDFRNGLCIKFNNDLWQIIEFQHVKPGKGPAFVRTKLKNLTNGKRLDNTFTAGVKIEVVRIENRQYQFLYPEGDTYHFMNTDNYEQIFLDKALINSPQFLKEGDNVDILFHSEEERPLTCELKPSVILEITYTEPGIKGDTATNAMKPAKVETGAEINVPLFINIGDRVKIDSKTGAYSERVKS
ncbi:MAG: elongation factor P [Flavobacteriales bacterium]